MAIFLIILSKKKTIGETFQGNLLNSTDIIGQYRMNDYWPNMCMMLQKDQRYKCSSDSPVYQLKLRLNDQHLVAQTTFFNLSYEVNLYYICVNESVTHMTVDDDNYCRGRLISKKLIRPDEVITYSMLHYGQFAIEIIPKIQSSQCENMCPILGVTGIFNEENVKLKCEECQKMLHFFEIVSDSVVDQLFCLRDKLN